MDPDVTSLLLGKLLGEGVSRRVYEHGTWPEQYVVKVSKVEAGIRDFQNIAEYEMWKNASDPLAAWLAPVICVSPYGHALVQVRCEPCPEHLLPTKLPKVLGDLHAGNIGLHKGRPVVMDYGRHYAYAMANNVKATKLVMRGSTR